MQYIDDIQISLFPKQLQLIKFYAIHAIQKAQENVITCTSHDKANTEPDINKYDKYHRTSFST